MPVHVYLFAALAIASVPLFVWSVRGVRMDLPTRRRRIVRANLGVATAPVPNLRQVVLSQGTADRILQPVIDWFSKTARRLTPAQLLQGLEDRRLLAGADSGWTMERLLAAKLLLGAVGALVGLAVFASSASMLTLLAAVLFTFGTFFVPDLLLGARGRERQKEIERAFPGVLDQLTICVEAGLGLDAALDRAARSGKGPLAEELARVMQDVQLGVSRQAALEALVRRTDVSDIRHFVVALGQANRYGVPIVTALRVQATEARRAATEPGRGTRPEDGGEVAVPARVLHPAGALRRPAGTGGDPDRSPRTRRAPLAGSRPGRSIRPGHIHSHADVRKQARVEPTQHRQEGGYREGDASRGRSAVGDVQEDRAAESRCAVKVVRDDGAVVVEGRVVHRLGPGAGGVDARVDPFVVVRAGRIVVPDDRGAVPNRAPCGRTPGRLRSSDRTTTRRPR